MSRIAVDYDETKKTYIRDDVAGVQGITEGLDRLRIVESVGPTEIHSTLLPLSVVEPTRPFGKRYYTKPNRLTRIAIQKAESEGIKRLERIRRRKPYPKNGAEREAVRETKKMLDEFRISEDLDQPEYYQALRNRRHWYDPLPDNTDTLTEAEEGLHECWRTSHKYQQDWTQAKWNRFWDHALSRSAMQDFRKFK